jgi:hypothetical protein
MNATTTREQTIARLIEYRDALQRDLDEAPGWRVGTDWWVDRVKELGHTVADLARLAE